MGSIVGVIKVAAKRIGVTEDEYRKRRSMGQKWCTYCKKWRDKNQFPSDSSRGDALAKNCRDCNSARSSASRYGISINEVRRLWKQPCGICGRKAKMEIDHDHKTGIVRGPLCNRCNGALGHFMDSEDLLKRAIKYLRKGKICPKKQQ